MTATGFKSKYSWTQPAKKKNKKKNAVVVYPCCSSWSTAEQHSENCLVRLGGAARPLRTPASDGQHIDKRKTCPGSPTSTRLTPGGARQMFTLHRLRHSVAKHAYACSTSPKTPQRLNGVSGVRGGFFFFLSFFFWLHNWAKLATKFGSGRGILFQHVTNPDPRPGTGCTRHNTVITQAHSDCVNVWGAYSSLENQNVIFAPLSQEDRRRGISASASPLKQWPFFSPHSREKKKKKRRESELQEVRICLIQTCTHLCHK